MDTLKAILVTGATVLVAVFGLNMTGAFDKDLGGVPGVNLIPSQGLVNQIRLAPTATTSQDYTLKHFESGSIVYVSASGTVTTLPSVREGLRYRFVVSGAIDTANWVIDSAEGDNIDGTLIVAGAVVDCRGEDQINIVADGEAAGDYVELYSNGSQWFIGDSGALTASKMTCTDPS